MWVLVVLFCPYFVQATFPPVSNPPPIPIQPVRTFDIPGQVYAQEELPSFKEDGYFPPPPVETKNDEQRWYPDETDSSETGDYISSTESFDRFYSNGEIAVGPVATPLPDTYVAEQIKFVPNSPRNVGPSNVWVLSKGPNDQYTQERWIQVQVPNERLVEVVNSPEPSSKILPGTIKSFPEPSPAVKNPQVPPPNVNQQVWVKSAAPIQSPQIYKGAPTGIVEDFSRQVVDVPSKPVVKQYIQGSIVQGIQPPVITPPQQPFIKSSGFSAPPPPPPLYKGGEEPYSKQVIVVNQPPIQPTVGKSGVRSTSIPQFKHIWIPTSQQTGKFITVPVGSVMNLGKSNSVKSIPSDRAVAVSDTWILRNDGSLPRFELQKSVSGTVVPNENIVAEVPLTQFDSPKNPSLFGKSINSAPPLDPWPIRKDVSNPVKYSGKAIVPAPEQLSNGKSVSVVVGKTISVPANIPPKTAYSFPKNLQPIPQPPALPQVLPLPKGKLPCPVHPPKTLISPKSPPITAYRSIPPLRQPFARIIRVNRFPYGPYYVLNPRVGRNLYSYPRLQAPIFQKNKNGVVRVIPARQTGIPIIRKVSIPVSRRQPFLPINREKSAAPQIIYPPIQSVNRFRYTYPWGSYISTLPITGKNGLGVPPFRQMRIEALESLSSESSSSESSSESKAASKHKKKKIKVTKTKKTKFSEEKGAPSSVESEEFDEPTENHEETKVSETTSENVEVTPSETKADTVEQESLELAESQIHTEVASQTEAEPGTQKEFPDKQYLYEIDHISPRSVATGERVFHDNTDGKGYKSKFEANADNENSRQSLVSYLDNKDIQENDRKLEETTSLPTH